jgi:hypothetical protein
MHRLEVLNKLISKYNYKSYLEIGVSNGHTFDNINIDITNKIGVDPDCEVYKVFWSGKGNVFCVSSNEFFKDLDLEQKFDLIFIDGLHLAEQVFIDIVNSLSHLNQNGLIIVHDCSPQKREHATEYNNHAIWNGTVYRGFIEAVKTYDLEYHTLDEDYGCGIIKYKEIDLEKKRIIINNDWEYFISNKKELLNIINIDEFYKL